VKTRLCNTCGLAVRLPFWDKHCEDHEKLRQFKCPAEGCSLVFSDVPAFYTHTFNKHGIPLKCHECDFTSHSLINFHGHVRYFHKPKTMSCDICKQYSTNKPGRLKAHIENTHVKKHSYFCAVCSKGFFDRAFLAEHLNIHRYD